MNRCYVCDKSDVVALLKVYYKFTGEAYIYLCKNHAKEKIRFTK